MVYAHVCTLARVWIPRNFPSWIYFPWNDGESSRTFKRCKFFLESIPGSRREKSFFVSSKNICVEVGIRHLRHMKKKDDKLQLSQFSWIFVGPYKWKKQIWWLEFNIQVGNCRTEEERAPEASQKTYCHPWSSSWSSIHGGQESRFSCISFLGLPLSFARLHLPARRRPLQPRVGLKRLTELELHEAWSVLNGIKYDTLMQPSCQVAVASFKSFSYFLGAIQIMTIHNFKWNPSCRPL